MNEVITAMLSAAVGLGTAFIGFKSRKQDSIDKKSDQTIQVLEDLRADYREMKSDYDQMKQYNQDILEKYQDVNEKLTRLTILVQEMNFEMKKNGLDYSEKIEKIV